MDFSLTTLFVLPNGNIAPANYKREALKPAQFGIFNSRYKAVVDATGANASPYIVFGQGRIEQVPGLTHKYTDKINPRNLIEWYKTTASPTSQSQISYVGFDGVDTTKTITVSPEEQFSVTVRARSLYLDLAYNYGLTRTVTVTAPCGVACGSDCTTVDPRIISQLVADAINAEPKLSHIVKATPVFSCTTAPTAPSTVAVVIYTGTKTDNGDAFALAVVQNQYPADDITLVGHSAGVSTYQMVRLSGDTAPADANAIDWSAAGTGVKVKRALTITLATADPAATLTALSAFYPNATVTQLAAAGGNAEYKLVETSTNIFPDAASASGVIFPDVQDYQGNPWTVQAVALTGSGCVAGIKIEGKPLDKYGNPCDPIAYPYEFDRLIFDVFAYKGAATSQDDIVFDRCDFAPVTKVQNATYPIGAGDEIFMLEKRHNSEQTTGVAKHIYHNATWNGGFVRYSDPALFYDTYVLKFKSPDLATWSNQTQQDETVIIAVPTGTGSTIETFLTAYLGTAKFNAGVL